jgi:hypothetical protein
MAIPRVEITSWERWGMLVKSWATGENKFHPSTNLHKLPAPSLPKDLAEFKAQCTQFGVGINIPDRITGVQFVQSNQETLLVRLPDAEMVTDSEQAIQADPNAYPLPPFYRKGFNSPLFVEKEFYSQEPTVNSDNCMIFHACRIGDYTIAQCG